MTIVKSRWLSSTTSLIIGWAYPRGTEYSDNYSDSKKEAIERITKKYELLRFPVKKNSQLELYALLSSQSWRKIVNKSQTDRVGSFEKQGRMEHECSNYSHESAGTSINGRQSWPRGGAATQPRIRGPYYASKWHKFPCKFGFERCCKIRFQNATTRKYSTSPLRLPRDDSATRTFPLTPTTVWTISLPFPRISRVAFPLRSYTYTREIRKLSTR